VVANKEENRKEDIQQLRAQCEVLVTEINTIEDALIWIDDLGRKLEAQDLSQHLLKEIQLLLPEENEFSEIPTAYFIWKDPWMTVGKDTYIHDVMKKFGLLNVFGDDTRYPETTLKELKTRYPRVILLSSEPFPFKEKHIQEIQKEIPHASIQLIDGELFSWYGSRMLPSFKALRLWREKLIRQ
jgi:ABC-type Fe3+-hydroxamate transport system substrate-binding protein